MGFYVVTWEDIRLIFREIFNWEEIQNVIYYVVWRLLINTWIKNLVRGVIIWRLIDLGFKAYRKWFPAKYLDLNDSAVLITGCDSGFGHELARRLDSKGVYVYAGCLEPLESGAAVLREDCSEKLKVIPLDVTSDDQVKKAFQLVKNTLDGKVLWAVVNNAGIGVFAEFEWCSISQCKKIMDVNVIGAMRVTKAFLPLLRQSSGRVIMVTCITGRLALPGMTAYSASKHALVAFADGLRKELKKWGISVHTVEPFFYSTGFVEESRYRDLLRNAWNATPIEIQQAYGTNYYREFRRQIRKRWWFRKNLNEVIDDLENAIFSSSPKLHYVTSALNKLVSGLLTKLPTRLQDYLVCLAMEPWITPEEYVKNMIRTLSRSSLNSGCNSTASSGQSTSVPSEATCPVESDHESDNRPSTSWKYIEDYMNKSQEVKNETKSRPKTPLIYDLQDAGSEDFIPTLDSPPKLKVMIKRSILNNMSKN